ncbi:MAG: hypothetical protein IPP47_32850 [Bryobacterales bacterium]|nr:hypothetical protein [Bryobacterales bacterium]
MTVAIGLVITFLGFLLSLFSLSLTTSVGTRMAMVLAGIALSLIGIVGVVNRAYLKNAIWKR